MDRNALVRVANKIGATLLADNDQWTNRVQIKSASSSRLYTIAQNKANKTWGCSCPGWIRHRNCKHLDVVVPAIRQLSGE